MTKDKLPEGMVAWNGGDSAPADWDGGPVLFKAGYLSHGKPGNFAGYIWGDDGQGTIIAYTPKAPPRPVEGDAGELGWNPLLSPSDQVGDATGVVQVFQAQVRPWLMACFGEMIAGDREERNHRFLEEALELVQSCGCTASEAHQLVDYVYGRPVGDLHQEVGGVMVTLAALCLANDADMHAAGWVELDRIWGKVEQIRAKQAAKPKHSPLPAAPLPPGVACRMVGMDIRFPEPPRP